MRIRNIIALAALGELAADAVKKKRQPPRDIRGTYPGKDNGSTPDKAPGDSKNIRPDNAPADSRTFAGHTAYEGADITREEAEKAGFEFSCHKNYHGLDSLIRTVGAVVLTDILKGYIPDVKKRIYAGKGLPACIITGYHGSEDMVKIPRRIGGRPVLNIECRAFAGQENIRQIFLPDSVLKISDCAFMSCTGLTYVRLSKNLFYIGDMAFAHCIGLKRLYPRNVIHIGREAFCGCRSLGEICLADKMEYIGDRAFYGSGAERVYSRDIKNAGSEVFVGTPYFERSDCIILGRSLQKCSLHRDVIDLSDVDIRSVDRNAFAGAGAQRVIFDRRVSIIGDRAFAAADIREIHAPGARNFGHCCFPPDSRVTVYSNAFQSSKEAGYLSLCSDSFMGTALETRVVTGSPERPIVCYVYRNVLLRISDEPVPGDISADSLCSLLTFADGGNTLVMDKSIGFAAAERIPAFGAKKLVVSGKLRSWSLVQEFSEVQFDRVTELVREEPYWLDGPGHTLTLHYKFKEQSGSETDSSVLIYLPQSAEDKAQLSAMYADCFRSRFDFEMYDRVTLRFISPEYPKFTAARMRLQGGLYLAKWAREAYEQFFYRYIEQARNVAAEHNDTALLYFLCSLPKEDCREGAFEAAVRKGGLTHPVAAYTPSQKSYDEARKREKRIVTGSPENPIICYAYNGIIFRFSDESPCNGADIELSKLLTFCDNGDTLVMDSSIRQTMAEYIPTYGAKKLVISGRIHSWRSVRDFAELELHTAYTGVSEQWYYSPSRTVILRFKITNPDGSVTDSPVLLYLPNMTRDSGEADSLRSLYRCCLATRFNFSLYDREILSLISSWHGKFTAARMRLTGGLSLLEGARKKYLKLFYDHRKKAEFIAGKHNDTELLNFLEDLEKYR